MTLRESRVGSQTYTYDARDQLVSGGGSTSSYTARGTLAATVTGGVTVTSTSDAYGDQITQGSQTYAYDGLGRVVTASGAGSYQFAYSGTGATLASERGREDEARACFRRAFTIVQRAYRPDRPIIDRVRRWHPVSSSRSLVPA